MISTIAAFVLSIGLLLAGVGRFEAELRTAGEPVMVVDSLHPFARAGKYGFKDDDGVVRIQPRYDGAGEFTESLAPVAVISGTEVYRNGEYGKQCFGPALKWGYINPAGDTITPFRYLDARGFSEHLAAVRAGDMWGYIDVAGRWVVKPMFADADDFHGGFARVQLRESGKAAYIDKTGRLVSPAPSNTNNVLDFKDGVSLVYDVDSRSSSLVDRDGRVITKSPSYPPTGYEMDRVGRNSFVFTRRTTGLKLLGEGLAAYGDTNSGPLGLMDVAGRIITPQIFEAISPFSNALAAAKKDGLWGFIDRNGRIVITPSFDSEGEFHDGLAVTRSKGRLGYIDRSGNFVVRPRFFDAGPFREGLANVCVETGSLPAGPGAETDVRCGFIDTKGDFVITPRFSRARPFDGAWASVEDPVFGLPLLVNRKGVIVERPSPSDLPHLQPSGECEAQLKVPMPVLAPGLYSIPITVGSSPSGASLYLVPLWDWQTHQDGAQLLADVSVLSTYLVTQGVTPLASIKLKSQVYMAVFELAGKRKIAKLVVAPNAPRKIDVSF